MADSAGFKKKKKKIGKFCAVDLSWGEKSFLRLTGIPDSKCDLKVHKEMEVKKAIISDTEIGNYHMEEV